MLHTNAQKSHGETQSRHADEQLNALQALLMESARREQLLIQCLLQQGDGIKVRDILAGENAKDRTVRNPRDTSNFADAEVLPLHLPIQSDGKEANVFGGEVPSEVRMEPVNTSSGDLSRLNGFSPRHGSTVNHIDRRPFVPHHLVGAPADQKKILSQDACQNPPVRHYTGLYIDQSNESIGTEAMATTKPTQGILISDAVQVVLKHWHETGTVEPPTLVKYTNLLERYAQFATNLEAPLLAAQSEELAAQWIRSKGRDRSGNIVEPATSTMSNRRNALRKFFRDAETLNLSETGLVVRTHVPPRPTGLARPLTEQEARRVWMYANDAGPHTRRPVIFALLLSGVHSSEVGLITVNDVDISNHRVWAHGDTTRIKPRWVNLEEPYFTAITERIDFVRDWLPPHYGFGTFQLTQGHFKRPRGGSQNRAASACKEVFRMVGLNKNPDITPSSVSLYAGARMLRDGARIETITKTLGYASLDSCAKALCFDWETGEIA